MARRVTDRTAPLAPKDFAWTRWRSRDIARVAASARRDYDRALTALKRVPAAERTFANTVRALDRADDAVGQTHRKIEFLMQAHPDARLRAVAHRAADALLQFLLDRAYDEKIYHALRDYHARAKRGRFSVPERRLLRDILRDARRLGLELPRKQRAAYQRITKRLAKLASEFQKNINDYDDGIWVARGELAGLPERYIAALRRNAKGQYYVSLAYPELFPFLEQAENPAKRRELALKHYRRGGARNVAVLRAMVRLRHRAARLLGYPNHAAYQLEVRMAKRVPTVRRFLLRLLGKLAPGVRKDRALLETYQRRLTKDPRARLAFSDNAYYANRYKREHFRVDADAVREYFPLPTVLRGMFGIYERLLGVTFRRAPQFAAWHRDAAWYEARDPAGVLGYFALDLHPRPGKYGHAAVFPLVETSLRSDGRRAAPVCALICNFPPSAPARAGGPRRPSLLSHDEVEVLFHEFGHAVHVVLSQAPFARQAGTRTVLDFVEAPSQMLENWIWDAAMLRRLSGHYRDPQRKLPAALLRGMLRTKKFLIASWATRQCVLALYDHLIHTKTADRDILALHPRLMRKYLHTDLPPHTRFGAGFGHIGGGYDAGYYGYLWSNVYAADMFTRFAREGLLSTRAGMAYRREILEPGSSRDELDSVRAFLRRAPNDAAFLRAMGLRA